MPSSLDSMISQLLAQYSGATAGFNALPRNESGGISDPYSAPGVTQDGSGNYVGSYGGFNLDATGKPGIGDAARDQGLVEITPSGYLNDLVRVSFGGDFSKMLAARFPSGYEVTNNDGNIWVKPTNPNEASHAFEGSQVAQHPQLWNPAELQHPAPGLLQGIMNGDSGGFGMLMKALAGAGVMNATGLSDLISNLGSGGGAGVGGYGGLEAFGSAGNMAGTAAAGAGAAGAGAAGSALIDGATGSVLPEPGGQFQLNPSDPTGGTIGVQNPMTGTYDPSLGGSTIPTTGGVGTQGLLQQLQQMGVSPQMAQQIVQQMSSQGNQSSAGGFNLGSLAPLLGIGSGLNTLLNPPSSSVDPARINALWQAGQDTYTASQDPQNAMRGRMQQGVVDATRGAESARGITMGGIGAGIESDAVSKFLQDWQNQQLQRQQGGVQSFAQAGNVAANAGLANNVQAFMQNQTGLNNLMGPSGLGGLFGTTGGGGAAPTNAIGSWLNSLFSGGGATPAFGGAGGTAPGSYNPFPMDQPGMGTYDPSLGISGP